MISNMESVPKLYAVVVIYNKRCDNSITCRCLVNIKNIQVLIVDNSTEDYQNKSFCIQNNWQYIDMNGNKGLSKAYNRAIETICNLDAVICIFDDDSEIHRDYFDSLLKKVLEDHEAKIFIPYVYDENGLVSPCIINGMDVKRANSLSEINKDNITAINSGMAIRKEVFINYKYDERYFVDYIDHAFIRDMKRKECKISVFETRIDHRLFFAESDTDVDFVIKRFKIFKKDFRRFCGKTIKGQKTYYMKINKQKLYLFLTHRKNMKLLFM